MAGEELGAAIEQLPAALVDDLGAALVAIVCCAGAALACWYWGREIEPTLATVVGFVGATGFVYLGSVAIIEVIGDDLDLRPLRAGRARPSTFLRRPGPAASGWRLRLPTVPAQGGRRGAR
jgi:hypothetical protein